MQHDLSRRLRRPQQGFTLIELIVVIVILGILAATAVPQMLDLRRDAQMAVLQGVAAALNSANVTNFAASQLPTPPAGTREIISGTTACGNLDELLVPDGTGAGNGNRADANLPDNVQWVNRTQVITCNPAIGGASRQCRVMHGDLGDAAADTIPVSFNCTRDW